MRNVILAALLSLIVALPALTADDKPLTPTNLTMNTPGDEDEPHAGDAGLTLYYGVRQKDHELLYSVRRRLARELWPKRGVEIEDYVKNKGDIRGVFATQGRYPHYLYFAARDPEAKNYDLFVAIKHDANKV